MIWFSKSETLSQAKILLKSEYVRQGARDAGNGAIGMWAAGSQDLSS
jgi:hypothetical protein